MFLFEGGVSHVERYWGVTHFGDQGGEIWIKTIAAKHLGIHGHFGQCEVVRAFIKMLMVSLFDSLQGRVNPDSILE